MSRWDEESVRFLAENWGNNRRMLASKLKRSPRAILDKAKREGLPSIEESLDGITTGRLAEIFDVDLSRVVMDKWIKRWGLPYEERSPYLKRKVKLVNLDDFWKWAKNYKMEIDFSVLEYRYLGYEPEWVSEVREIQSVNRKFTGNNLREWTKEEDDQLRSMLEAFCFTYSDISRKLQRSECSICNRMKHLGIKARPIEMRRDGEDWEDSEYEELEKYASEGYHPAAISYKLQRSERAIRKKLTELRKSRKDDKNEKDDTSCGCEDQ